MTRFGNLNKLYSAAVITAEDTTANMLGTARDITVHDFTGHFSGDVYDQTQTDSSIKDGDVLDLGQGNVAIMVKAWPTIAVGEIEHFHTLESGSSFDTLEAGKYAASAVKAREVASKAHNNGNLQPVNSRFAAGDWMHLFEVGGLETECRVAIDSEKGELLVAMERVSSMAFQEIRGARFRDLAESVINANEAHKDPEEHGLERSSELPAWAAAILVERDQVSGNVESAIDHGVAADNAFDSYEFGEGVIVADSSGWEYETNGHEQTCKVYVEVEHEDDGPAQRLTLHFTVRFDPVSGALAEAYAMDNKGQIWGHLPQENVKATQDSTVFVLPEPMQRLQLAEQFYNELNDSVEVLSDIAEQHGARTLSDLFHLHASIINNGFIDAWPDSAVIKVVSQLPSADRWIEYASVYDENGRQKESIFSKHQAQVLGHESQIDTVKAVDDSPSPGM